MTIKNRVGERHNLLTVVKFHGFRASGNKTRHTALWECLCDCGNVCFVGSSKLGETKSCGHLKNASGHLGANFKHGYSRRSEYHSWNNARERCNNPKNDSYHDYGGRGIKFLYTSFDQFLADVGDKPSQEHSLDRQDCNGHYEPGNCRWADGSTQNKNKRPSKSIENFSDREIIREVVRRQLQNKIPSFLK